MDVLRYFILAATTPLIISCALDDGLDSTSDDTDTFVARFESTWISSCELWQAPVINSGEPNDVIYQQESVIYQDGVITTSIETYSDADCTILYENFYTAPIPPYEGHVPFRDEINFDAWRAEYFPFVSYKVGVEVITDTNINATELDLITANGEIYKTIFSLADEGRKLIPGKRDGKYFYKCAFIKNGFWRGYQLGWIDALLIQSDSRYSTHRFNHFQTDAGQITSEAVAVPYSFDFAGLTFLGNTNDLTFDNSAIQGLTFGENVYELTLNKSLVADGIVTIYISGTDTTTYTGDDLPTSGDELTFTCLMPNELDHDRPYTLVQEQN